MPITIHTRNCSTPTFRLVIAIVLVQIVVFLIIEKRLSKNNIFHILSSLENDEPIRASELNVYDSYLNSFSYSFTFETTDLRRSFKIIANGSDVIIFLRVQKTGSMTLAAYLQDYIDVTPWCMCPQSDNLCKCHTIWTELVGAHDESLTNNIRPSVCNCSQDAKECPCRQGAGDPQNMTLSTSQYEISKHNNPYLKRKSSKSLKDHTSTTSVYRDINSGNAVRMKTWCNCSGSDQNCACYKAWKNNVLFQGYQDNWPCGVHADWTYLQTCATDVMNKRIGTNKNQRHMYITMVRDPFERYVSEWLFVNWTGVYFDYIHPCRDRRVTKLKAPLCPRFPKWKGITLREFMKCESNQAVNRQTRMLADLISIHCDTNTAMAYDEKHYKMLESARNNLRNMAFFGLTKHQELTQILFEHTFDIHFRVPFKTLPQQSGKEGISEDIRQKIIFMNRFDVLLYQYAEDLFRQRIFLLVKETKDESLRRRITNLIRPLLK